MSLAHWPRSEKCWVMKACCIDTLWCTQLLRTHAVLSSRRCFTSLSVELPVLVRQIPTGCHRLGLRGGKNDNKRFFSNACGWTSAWRRTPCNRAHEHIIGPWRVLVVQELLPLVHELYLRLSPGSDHGAPQHAVWCMIIDYFGNSSAPLVLFFFWGYWGIL